ncbi:MAG: ribbon-helix-helix domain-containing protein [Opitutaceae bacterium]|jgi:hypothetical protein|nr:ribbon-helix-helix domain-containing protein [Opitutaceae bacterium]
MSSTKKVKRPFSLDADVLEKMQEIADTNYGGNLSAAVEDAIRDRLEASQGPLSKWFSFCAEIRTTLRRMKLSYTSHDNAVDWVLPELSLGLEAKVKFGSGKPETAAVSAMAFTIGQKLCQEIWIVGADTMPADDRAQWERVARDFHLCKVRVVFASQLEQELRKRMGAK